MLKLKLNVLKLIRYCVHDSTARVVIETVDLSKVVRFRLRVKL